MRAYKRPGVAHDVLVSAILQPPKQTKLDDEQCLPPPKREPLLECWKPPPPEGVDPPPKCEPLLECWKPPPPEGVDPPPKCEPLLECWKPPPQGVDPQPKREPLLECWKPPPPQGVDMDASKENHPSGFQNRLPVVFNFNFGRC